MKKLAREEALRLWGAWWDEMEQEWFKVEVLQDYSGEDTGASLDAWLSGDREAAIRHMQDRAAGSEWVAMCAAKPGVEKIRIHIVEDPRTPYLEWEIEWYTHINVPRAGETVYLLEKSKVVDLPIPDGDFVVFDKTRVAKNTYDDSGTMASMNFYDKTDNGLEFLRLREHLLARVGKPLSV